MNYRTVVRAVSILFFREEDSRQYDGSLQLQIGGTVGTIHSLVGGGFYKALKLHGFGMFRDLGLQRILVGVSEPHLRLIERQLKGLIQVKRLEEHVVAGRKLIRVELTEA